MEKSLQLIADLAKLFNWVTRMNSIPNPAWWNLSQRLLPGWIFRWKWSRPSKGQAALPKTLRVLGNFHFKAIPWKFHHWTSQFRGWGCSEPFFIGVVEDPSNPADFFLAAGVTPATPKHQNSVQWIHITTSPPPLRPNNPRFLWRGSG